MITLTLAQIAAAVNGVLVGPEQTAVRAVHTDSRAATRGGDGLFVALRGEHTDGHRFVESALSAGATAALVDRPDVLGGRRGVIVDDTWQAIGALGALVRTMVGPDVIAITGSVGKTTTKDLAAGALGADRPTVAAAGSFNNELGVPLTLLDTAYDTRALVVEVGARGVGHIAKLMPWVAPDVAIVTAVAGAHLEQFGDLATVARAKGELVEALTLHGTAVLNADDRLVLTMAGRTDGAILTYSARGAGADVRALDVTLDALARPTFSVETPWGSGRCSLPVAGLHNVGNALAAIAAACTLGVPLDTATDGVASAEVSGWRGAVAVSPEGVIVCNDAYNANPTSALAALDMLEALRTEGAATIAVLGVMAELGPSSASGHAEVGRAAGRTADLVIAVGDVAPLVEAARAVGAPVEPVADAATALALVRSLARPGDAVLVKGSRVAGLETVAAGLLDPTGEPS